MTAQTFAQRYGPWALIAGASEGLGLAFANEAADRGLNLILLARRTEPLEAAAAQLRERGVEARAHSVDLAAPSLAQRLTEITEGLDVGLAIYNAAYAPVGELTARSLDELERIVNVNTRGPMIFAKTLVPPMLARGHGGLVLMSSLAGMQGTPRLAGYAASKAFNTVLAESLWGELGPQGVDVIASCAGAIRTPGYVAAEQSKEAPGTLDAAVVARQTLSALGGGPRVVPGFVNKLASLVVGRWLPRKRAVRIMAANTKSLE